MRMTAIASLIVALLAAAGLRAQEPPKPAVPLKEHEWLQQLVGEWEGDFAKATASTRMLGGVWMVSDVKATIGDTSMSAVLSIGYDPQKKKYVGTWIDSVTTYLWTYEGSADAAGKVLTLESRGPNPAAGGKITTMRDVIEIKSKDHFAMVSSMLGDDGKWYEFMTVNYKRKK